MMENINMVEMKPNEPTEVQKRNDVDRKHNTNCYDCEIILNIRKAKLNPNDEGDKRFFCRTHWKKRFGKKKKLIKRY